MIVDYKNIPLYNVKQDKWEEVSFSSQEEFAHKLDSLFSDKCEYHFDETSLHFNKHAKHFDKHGCYHNLTPKTKEWIEWWDFEKLKCTKGVFFKNGDKEWYLPREYYDWLNFLKLANKEQDGAFTFPYVLDIQYHLALYEKRAECHNKHAILTKKRQMASEQPHSEPVLGEYGWTTMGELKIGDKVMSPYGKLVSILDKSFHKNAEVYELTFQDGRSVKCGIEHNWKFFDQKGRKYKIIQTKDILKSTLFSKNTYRFSVDQTNPIEFEEKQLKIDPYILGVLIGDGSLTGNSINFRCDDRDLQIKNIIFDKLGEDYTYNKSKEKITTCHKYSIIYKKRFDFKDKDSIYGINPLIRALKAYNLMGCNSYSKRIPFDYMNSSIAQRIELVQGLMDSDGFINSNGKDICFTSCNKLLCEDLLYILRSLGVSCCISDFKTFFRVRISGKIKFDLFKLDRKRERQKLRENQKSFTRTNLVSIKKLDYKEDSSCLILDSEDHLYITRDFLITHNSLYHCGKLYNRYCFSNNSVNKIFASNETYLTGENGIWKFFSGYKEFRIESTAWKRYNLPDQDLSWMQRREYLDSGGNKRYKGTLSTLTGISTRVDATKGVGGYSTYGYHEESGIAPKLDKTYRFFKSAVEAGNRATGMFIAAGSVGDLAQCIPLKNYMYAPEENGFLGVNNYWNDKSGKPIVTGLYIPEHWGMPGFIDEYGNSKQEEALKYLLEKYAAMEKSTSVKKEEYYTEISQHPIYLEDAFRHRKVGEFPTDKLQRQQERIKERERTGIYGDGRKKPIKCLLTSDDKGEVIMTYSDLPIEHEYPIKPNNIDKRGVVTIYELPEENPKMGTYFGGLDPIEVDITVSSDSIASLDIIKKRVEVEYKDDKTGKIEKRIEGGKLVATYRGRFNTVEETNEQMWLLIKMYNAFVLVERNKPNFINYMKRNGRANLHLAREKDIPLFKEESLNSAYKTESPFGFNKGSNTTINSVWKYFKDFVKEYFQEEFGFIYKTDGSVLKTFTGIDKVDDYWLLEELIQYDETNLKNFDRLVSFFAAISLWKIKESNSPIEKVKYTDKTEQIENQPVVKKINFLDSGSNNYSKQSFTQKQKRVSLI